MSIILSVAAVFLGAATVTLETIDGQKHTGDLTQLDQQQAVIRNTTDSATIAVDEILRVVNDDSLNRLVEPRLTIWLTDGSVLAARRFELQNDLAKIGLLKGVTAEIDPRHLHRVRLRKPGDPHPLDQPWADISAQEHEGDVIVILKSGQVLDYLEGAIGDVSADEVQFSFDGDAIAVKRRKLEGFVFLTPRTEQRRPVRVVYSTGNSVWNAENIRWLGDAVDMELMCGAKIRLPATSVRSIDFAATRIVYLSSLEPYKLTVTPRLTASPLDDLARRLIYNPGINRNLSGGRLSLLTERHRRQREYFDRGLALHSRTELIYRLSDEFSRLQGIAGIDPDLEQRGSVRLVIEGDDRVLLDQALGANDAPIPIDLDIAGVARLRILVDYGDEFDVADHLNLCEMRLMP